MKKFNRKVFAAAGYNTVFMGPGRKEFNPKKKMAGFEDYLLETAKGTADQLDNTNFDEGVISNFMASRFIRQGNLAGFLPFMMESLKGKPCTRVEGACGSGGLGISSAVKSILSGMADSVFVTGFEIQNTVKALYGADILAGAAYHAGERKDGHAFFFPGVFSERAGAYYEQFGYERARQGMARWYENSVENARKCPKAQEYHNSKTNLLELGMTQPNGNRFVDHLNLFDCSKVSDGASSIVICSEEGLEKLGIPLEKAIEIVGLSSSEGDITKKPEDLTKLENTGNAANAALEMAGVSSAHVGVLELHDCFSITGILALEAIGFADHGVGSDFVFSGETSISGEIPTNLSGGLCGFGHPTGATGVRQLVDLHEQLTGKAENQADLKKEHGLMISMGGNDKTVTAVAVKKAGLSF